MIEAHKLRFLGEQVAIGHDLFILYCRTFQYKVNTYLISYCVYTTATVDVGFIRIGNEEERHASALRLRAALRILEAEGRQTPGIKKSVDIIKKQIKSAAAEGKQGSGSSRPQLGSRQDSFDQAFATLDPSYHHHSISGPSSTPMQEFEAYSQAGSSQYFANYAGFGGSQQAIASTEGVAWQTGGHHQDPSASYNPGTIPWNYEQFPNTGYTSGAPIYGWPPSSTMP
jgi:hypothetical protein